MKHDYPFIHACGGNSNPWTITTEELIRCSKFLQKLLKSKKEKVQWGNAFMAYSTYKAIIKMRKERKDVKVLVRRLEWQRVFIQWF
jgi:uncharacterized protein YktA (UPF0223 family)